MKLTTIVASASAALGLAACGAAVSPTVSPTLALTVAPTAASTPTPTPSASESLSPSTSASPSPTEGPCGYGPCGTGLAYHTTCGVPGTAQGGSLVVTWTAGDGQTTPVVPDAIEVDGNTLDVTSNPFTSGPYTVGDHTFSYPGGPQGPNGGLLPFTIGTCAVVTVTTICSTSSDTGTATFSGVTVGYKLVVGDIVADYIPSNPYTMPIGAPGSYTFTESGESNGDITMITGNFTIAMCAVPGLA
jgi:hypothetical protein